MSVTCERGLAGCRAVRTKGRAGQEPEPTRERLLLRNAHQVDAAAPGCPLAAHSGLLRKRPVFLPKPVDWHARQVFLDLFQEVLD